MADPVFYIYEHWRPDMDLPFYVGLGQGRRANVMYKRNYKHERIQLILEAKGMCVEVRLVRDNLYSEEAKRFEQERIKFWRTQGIALTNLTDGGDGSLNPSDETREKMRAAKLGGKLSDEHKRKIGEASRRSLADPEVKARLSAGIVRGKATPEAKAKASASQKARVRTKEHYEKVARALRGRRLSPEHIEANRQGHIGLVQSKEHIEKRTTAVVQIMNARKEAASKISLDDLLEDN